MLIPRLQYPVQPDAALEWSLINGYRARSSRCRKCGHPVQTRCPVNARDHRPRARKT
jgi:hypothetical protein